MAAAQPNPSASMYFSSTLGVLFSRVVGMFAGFVSLWLLTRILTEAEFAGYTFAMSLVFVLGFASGLGLERVMLLKISGLPREPDVLLGGRLVRRISFQVLTSSLLIVAATWAILTFVPALSANNNLAGWFAALAPIVPAVALLAVLIAWLQSNHIVGRPQALHGQIDGLRCLGFLGVFAAGWGAAAIAISAIAASIIPPAILAAKSAPKSAPEPSRFTVKDALDGLSFFGMRLAAIGFIHADIIIIGVLAPPEVVAPYVVASRFALLLEAGQQIFAPAYTPRVRQHLENGTLDLAAKEYRTARTLSFLGSTLAALALCLFGRHLLGFFGDFQDAYGAMLILCAGQVILVGAGLHAAHLSMSGHLSTAMTTQLSGLAIFVALLIVLTPTYGATGAALAFFAAHLCLAVVGLLFLWIRCRILPFSIWSLATYVLAAVSLLLIGLRPDLAVPGTVGLIIAVVLTGWHQRHLLSAVVSDGFGLLRPTR